MTNKKATRSRVSKAKTVSSGSAAMGSVISSASASAAANADGPAQASDFIVHDNSESALLKLPNEVKQRIWSLAVTVDEPIVPRQIRDKSNKFVWSKDQINKKTLDIEVGAVPQLTAVQLAKVCRSIYDDVATTHLFYQVNEFRFGYSGWRSKPPALIYLVAITEPRRKAIRNIQLSWQYMSKATGAQIFTLITACQGLQSLDLRLELGYFGNSTPAQLPGLNECLLAIQGLKKLTINVEDLLPGQYMHHSMERTKELCKKLESLFKERLTMARSKTYNLSKFSQAQVAAKLDVYGEGRLSEDKKPGQVSSRTRQQARNVDKLAADGTIPARESPKYDLNGDLAWPITDVEESREAVLDGSPSIEFLVFGGPSTNDTWARFHVKKGKEEKFWEDVSTLNSLNCRNNINYFYEKNPKAVGAQIVLDVWKLRDSEDDSEERMKLKTEQRLEDTISRRAAAEQKEAERAAVEARQAAKAAKASKKAPKAKKAKAVKGGR